VLELVGILHILFRKVRVLHAYKYIDLALLEEDALKTRERRNSNLGRLSAIIDIPEERN